MEKLSKIKPPLVTSKQSGRFFSNFCDHLRMSELFHKEYLKEQLEIWSEIKGFVF